MTRFCGEMLVPSSALHEAKWIWIIKNKVENCIEISILLLKKTETDIFLLSGKNDTWSFLHNKHSEIETIFATMLKHLHHYSRWVRIQKNLRVKQSCGTVPVKRNILVHLHIKTCIPCIYPIRGYWKNLPHQQVLMVIEAIWIIWLEWLCLLTIDISY